MGTFTLGNHCLATSMDNYSSRLTPERSNPGKKVHVLLEVSPSFDQSQLKKCDCTILYHKATEIFISCRSAMVEKIAALQGVTHCSVSMNIEPFLDSSRSQSGCNAVHGTIPSALSTRFTGRGILTGIVDTEFDTRHPAFLDSNGTTRFIALWDQQDSSRTKKNRFGYGIIKNHSELISDSTFGLSPDSHGTHTTSTMAGSGWSGKYVGAAPGSMLIAVKYKGTQEIINALQWIFSIADSLDVPCVINLSLGIAFGPHDGTSKIDRTIDSLSGPGRIIVGAIGNDGAKASHIRFCLEPGDSGATWIIPTIDSVSSDTATVFSAMDFWGEEGKDFNAGMFIMDRPSGKYLHGSSSISTTSIVNFDIDTVIWTDASTGDKSFFYIQRNVEKSKNNNKPHFTVYSLTSNKDLMLGVQITNAGTGTAVIHGWNIRHEIVHGFNTPGFSNGDTLFTVNEIGGTARRSITVGGYISRVNIPLWAGEPKNYDWIKLGAAFYSSGLGPTVDGRIKPDITAPAWLVIAAISRDIPRNFENIVVWPDTETTYARYAGQTGTSMASPFVAGIVALMLEADPDLTPEEVKTILHKTAIKDAFTGPLDTLSNQWGAGKVNAYGALTEILGIGVKKDHPAVSVAIPRLRHCGRRLFLSCLPNDHATVYFTDMFGKTVFSTYRMLPSVIDIPESVASGLYIARMKIKNRRSHFEYPLVIYK